MMTIKMLNRKKIDTKISSISQMIGRNLQVLNQDSTLRNIDKAFAKNAVLRKTITTTMMLQLISLRNIKLRTMKTKYTIKSTLISNCCQLEKREQSNQKRKSRKFLRKSKRLRRRKCINKRGFSSLQRKRQTKQSVRVVIALRIKESCRSRWYRLHRQLRWFYRHIVSLKQYFLVS